MKAVGIINVIDRRIEWRNTLGEIFLPSMVKVKVSYSPKYVFHFFVKRNNP